MCALDEQQSQNRLRILNLILAMLLTACSYPTWQSFPAPEILFLDLETYVNCQEGFETQNEIRIEHKCLFRMHASR